MTMKQKKAVRRNLEKARIALAVKRAARKPPSKQETHDAFALLAGRPTLEQMKANIKALDGLPSRETIDQVEATLFAGRDLPNRNTLDAIERNLQILTQQVLALRVTMKGLL